MKATIDETKVATLEDGRKNGEIVRLKQSTTHKSRSSTVRDSPLTGVLSGLEASIPALLYVWAENSFLCSTGPFGLILKAAPGCFRKYLTVGRRASRQKCWCFRMELPKRGPIRTYQPITGAAPRTTTSPSWLRKRLTGSRHCSEVLRSFFVLQHS